MTLQINGDKENEGIIPVELSRLNNLEMLNLSYNNLSGKSSDMSLIEVIVQMNKGSIPAEFSQLSCLKYLTLNDNKLTGKYDAATNASKLEIMNQGISRSS